MLKVAQYAAQLENYDRAIEIYEQVSQHYYYAELFRIALEESNLKSIICFY